MRLGASAQECFPAAQSTPGAGWLSAANGWPVAVAAGAGRQVKQNFIWWDWAYDPLGPDGAAIMVFWPRNGRGASALLLAGPPRTIGQGERAQRPYGRWLVKKVGVLRTHFS